MDSAIQRLNNRGQVDKHRSTEPEAGVSDPSRTNSGSGSLSNRREVLPFYGHLQTVSLSSLLGIKKNGKPRLIVLAGSYLEMLWEVKEPRHCL